MKKYLISFCIALSLFAVAAQAQTPAPTPSPVDHVFVSGSVLAFNGPNGMTASSNFGAALQLTPGVSMGYNQITIPSLNRTYRLGVVNYSKPLSSLVGKKLTSKFVFDLGQVNVTFQGGGGKVDQVLPNPVFSTVAETGGLFLSVALANHLSATVVGVQYLHGGTNPSQVTLTTGLNFHF